MASPTNPHSGHWDVVARDESARAELWGGIIRLHPARIRLEAIHERAAGTRSLCAQLDESGYRTLVVPGPRSPWLELPGSWEEMIGSLRTKLRGELRRRRRILEREGTVSFRTVSGGPTLERDLEKVLRLEASGWKGRAGTAILSDPATERVYRGFAHAAAREGWLRLRFLELDGEPIAADYGCVFAGGGVAIKVGVSEAHRRVAPGVLLLAEVLRSAIEEGVSSYDFLGESDAFKTEWTSEARPRARIWAYRRRADPGYLYRKRLRPLMKAARDRAMAARDGRWPRATARSRQEERPGARNPARSAASERTPQRRASLRWCEYWRAKPARNSGL